MITDTHTVRELEDQTNLLVSMRRWVRLGAVSAAVLASALVWVVLFGFDLSFVGGISTK